MFGLGKKIWYLEETVKHQERQMERLRSDLNLIAGDFARFCEYHGVEIRQVNKREIVKKGGPERGD